MRHRRSGQSTGTLGDPRHPFLRNHPYGPAGHVPLCEHRAHVRHVFRRGHQQHTFLGFGQHDLVAGHALLPTMHPVDVQRESSLASGHRLHGGAGQAGRAQVLQRAHLARAQRLQARLNQHLFQERVAHLHRGAEFLFFLKGTGCQARRAVNAVPPGAGPDEQQNVAGGVRGGAGQFLDRRDAHAHGVDQRVLRVGLVEIDFTSYVGHPDAVSVPADPVHHAAQQSAIGRLLRRPEAQGVEQRNRSGAHGQDVPHDAADAGSCALQRLHRGRVVVGFHLENHRQTVADVYRPGVLGAGLRQRAG